MRSDFREPLNLGQDRMVSINELVRMVASIAGKTIRPRHDLSKPQGVRGRNSDNSLLRRTLDWEPRVSLEEGLHRTYGWICQQLASGRLPLSGVAGTLAMSAGSVEVSGTGF